MKTKLNRKKMISIIAGGLIVSCSICLGIGFIAEIVNPSPTKTTSERSAPTIDSSTPTFTTTTTASPTNTSTPTSTSTTTPTTMPTSTIVQRSVPIIIPSETINPSGEVPCNCSGPDLNCPEFGFKNRAQACFDYCISQGYGDIFKLDSDNDGSVCENLP